MNTIDRFLNKITMYRLVFDYLIILIAIAAVFGAIGWLPYGPVAVIFSALFLTAVCWVTNGIIAAFLKAHPNTESVFITAFILTLIITPIMPTNIAGVMFLAWAGVLAMASKYVFAIGKKHIFNPAAFGVVVTFLAFGEAASWWVGGNLQLMAFVLVGGSLVLRKIQRFDLAFTFLAFALASDVVTHAGFSPLATIQNALVSTPLFFFASIMITEPLTTPPTRRLRLIYAAIVGALFSPFIAIGPINLSPELALLVGNIYSYIASPKGKQVLTLKDRRAMGGNMYDFVFKRERSQRLRFRPGQYLEWTLAHAKTDQRGNRRYFTIASSPAERDVHLGIKFYKPSSSFKKALLAMRPGDTIIAGQLAGDFTLPRDRREKLAFIAGGIGITPFRSMIQDLVDRNDRRDTVLFYSARTADEFAYREVFDGAEQALGIRTYYIATDGGARIDAATIRKALPDYRERTFYISGTHAMTNTLHDILRGMGVPRTHIKTDFFPGFA